MLNLLDIIQRHFGTWIVRPTVLITHYKFNYDENQFLFINRSNRDDDYHICIFACDTVAYICDDRLTDDGENVVGVSDLIIISLPLNRHRKTAPIDIPKKIDARPL
jgi:hypothetical protein